MDKINNSNIEIYKGFYEEQSKILGFRVIENPFDMFFKYYGHDQSKTKSLSMNNHNRNKLLFSAFLYFNGDLMEEHYDFFTCEGLYETVQEMMDEDFKFTCICTQKNCRFIGFVKHNVSEKVFLIGSQCLCTLSPRLNELYMIEKKRVKNNIKIENKRIKKEQKRIREEEYANLVRLERIQVRERQIPNIKVCQNCDIQMNDDSPYVNCYKCQMEINNTKVKCSTIDCNNRILPDYKICYTCNTNRRLRITK